MSKKTIHQSRLPSAKELERYDANDILLAIFGKLEAKLTTPDDNQFDVRVNVAMLRRAKELLEPCEHEPVEGAPAGPHPVCRKCNCFYAPRTSEERTNWKTWMSIYR